MTLRNADGAARAAAARGFLHPAYRWHTRMRRLVERAQAPAPSRLPAHSPIFPGRLIGLASPGRYTAVSRRSFREPLQRKDPNAGCRIEASVVPEARRVPSMGKTGVGAT